MVNSLYGYLGGLHGLQNQSSLSSQMNSFSIEQEIALRIMAQNEMQRMAPAGVPLRDVKTSDEVLLLL